MMLSFLFALMDKFLFPFKGLDARSLGPISCLAVPSSAIGPVIPLCFGIVLLLRVFFSPSTTDCTAR